MTAASVHPDLTGQVALVTGAARGQGRGHSLALAEVGAAVVALDICRDLDVPAYPPGTRAELDAVVAAITAAGGQALPVVADVRDPGSVADAVAAAEAAFGRLDILVNNAAIVTSAPFWELSEEQWCAIVDTNLSGVWRMTKAAARLLRRSPRGRIVHIASTAGARAVPEFAHYVAAKHGVVGLTRAMAIELAGDGVGQGRSHALKFAGEGADVAFCDIACQIDTVPYPMARQADLAETVKLVEELDRRCVGDVADVRDLSQVQAFVDRAKTELGRVDFLLANAGIFSFGTVADLDSTTWQDMIDTNLTGVFHAMRAVLPTMIEQKSGRIVATSSMAGKLGFPNVGHYVAAKWGVIGLAKSAAIEVAPHGITVNVICPTNVATPMIQNPAAYKLFLPDAENPTMEEAAPAFQSLNPIPVPWVEPIDISNAMAFLCSDEARYITGETLAVAAGFNASNAG